MDDAEVSIGQIWCVSNVNPRCGVLYMVNDVVVGSFSGVALECFQVAEKPDGTFVRTPTNELGPSRLAISEKALVMRSNLHRDVEEPLVFSPSSDEERISLRNERRVRRAE